MDALGIKAMTETSVVEVKEASVVIDDKDKNIEELPADLVVLTTGVEPTPLVKSLSLQKDSTGRVRTNRALQTESAPNVFVLGDCGSVDGDAWPATAQVAMQQSDIVAKNIIKRVDLYTTGEEESSEDFDDLHTASSEVGDLESFTFVPLGEMLTLGSFDAAVTSLGGLVKLQGPVASAARRLVYVARMPTIEQKVTAGISAGVVTAGNAITQLIARRRGQSA
jgi:NADH dehydrogenase